MHHPRRVHVIERLQQGFDEVTGFFFSVVGFADDAVKQLAAFDQFGHYVEVGTFVEGLVQPVGGD